MKISFLTQWFRSQVLHCMSLSFIITSIDQYCIVWVLSFIITSIDQYRIVWVCHLLLQLLISIALHESVIYYYKYKYWSVLHCMSLSFIITSTDQYCIVWVCHLLLQVLISIALYESVIYYYKYWSVLTSDFTVWHNDLI